MFLSAAFNTNPIAIFFYQAFGAKRRYWPADVLSMGNKYAVYCRPECYGKFLRRYCLGFLTRASNVLSFFFDVKPISS